MVREAEHSFDQVSFATQQQRHLDLSKTCRAKSNNLVCVACGQSKQQWPRPIKTTMAHMESQWHHRENRHTTSARPKQTGLARAEWVDSGRMGWLKQNGSTRAEWIGSVWWWQHRGGLCLCGGRSLPLALVRTRIRAHQTLLEIARHWGSLGLCGGGPPESIMNQDASIHSNQKHVGRSVS